MALTTNYGRGEVITKRFEGLHLSSQLRGVGVLNPPPFANLPVKGLDRMDVAFILSLQYENPLAINIQRQDIYLTRQLKAVKA
jgi:hypothetical protein